MLPVYLDISVDAKKIISHNVSIIFELMLDMCNNLSDEEVLIDIFPEHLIFKDIKKCRKTINELYLITRDDYERSELNTLQEYALFHSLLWWDTVLDENENYFDEIPLKQSYDKSGMCMHNQLNNKENYFDFLFEDWDFRDVPVLVAMYIKSSELVEKFLHVDLNDYLELMPDDIKDEYLKIKNERNRIEKVDTQEADIVKSIYNCLQILESRAKTYKEMNETKISDEIQNMLFLAYEDKGIHIDREDRAGFAIKDLGEMDFYIWQMKEGIIQQIAVGENKKWGNYEGQIYQLLGYMNAKTKFGFTIIQNDKSNLNNIRLMRKGILDKLKADENFKIVDCTELAGMDDVVVTTHKLPENSRKVFKIYHFILNFNMPEREKAAIKGRKRAKNKENLM